MKKVNIVAITVYTILIIAACATNRGSAVGTTLLDQAIQEAAENIESRLEQGVIIALLNFSSPSERFSEYILEELSAHLVNGGKLVVVDRNLLDLIRRKNSFSFLVR